MDMHKNFAEWYRFGLVERQPILGEVPTEFFEGEAHRLAHKLRDPKFYTARTKRAVNSGGAL
jgi:hypothetical protein